VGESYDDDHVPADGHWLRGDSDEGRDGDRGREWNGGDGHASPGRTNSHQTGGRAYGHYTSTHAHGYAVQDYRDCGTVRPSAHGYERLYNGGPAGD
jgi:hypothetical protein